MFEIILLLIGLPLIGGILCLLIPKVKEGIAIGVSLVTFVTGILIFLNPTAYSLLPNHFLLDNLSGFVVLSVALFGILIILYSIKFIQKLAVKQKISIAQYYCYVLWTLGASLGAVLSNNLILLLVFWGFLGLTLYLLIQIGHPSANFQDASTAAKKTFIIIGGSDCFMILGIVVIWFLTGTFQMDKIQLSTLNSQLSTIAFLCLAIASFAKAGAMPFHTWIPDTAVTAPIPITAYLPASLDKLLGIYLLVRICTNLFVLNLNLNLILMFIGAITIIAAVFMAMIQHNMKKLLSYHAVSQVGYMVMGIGTGNPVGVAGGLFHMLNNVIYKACLFLCAGSVEHKTETTDLDKLGGLAKYIPLTFFAALVASLSISGVPPFNGFFSKWMIYQGIIQQFSGSQVLGFSGIFFLAAAMFGSALTLASFMKLIHATFLGQSNLQNQQPNSEVHISMWLPQVALAGLCIVFGIFAYQVPLRHFILPSLSTISGVYSTESGELSSVFSGVWQPGLATLLIIVGIVIGFIIYIISGSRIRISDTYIGGETLPTEVRVTGVDFYQTIRDIGFFKTMYYLAEQKMFDIYDWGKKIVLCIGAVLSIMHSGNLQTYLGWCLIGLAVLLLILV